jgi:hypothetical protein
LLQAFSGHSHSQSARDSLVHLVTERVNIHPENQAIVQKLAAEKGMDGDWDLKSVLNKMETGDLLRAYEDMQKQSNRSSAHNVLTDL